MTTSHELPGAVDEARDDVMNGPDRDHARHSRDAHVSDSRREGCGT